MKLSCAYKIQERWYDQANKKVLKLENIHSHWRYFKEQNIEASEQKKNKNIAFENETSSSTHEDVSNAINVEISKTSSSLMIRFSIIREVLLRIQELTIMKFKERSKDSLNQTWSKTSRPSISQRRKQKTFKCFTRRESSEFKYNSKFSATQISEIQFETNDQSDTQSKKNKENKKDDQRDQRTNHRDKWNDD